MRGLLASKEKRDFLWVLLIVYFTDTILFGTNSNPIMKAIPRYGVILLVVIAMSTLTTPDGRKLKPIIDWPLIGVTASIGVSMVLSKTAGFRYITLIALIWFGYFFSKKMPLEEFAARYCKIMRVIAIVSIIGWLYASQIAHTSFLPVITNTAHVKYKFLLLTAIPESAARYRRNMGPFWEPGAYQVYLNIALMFTLFFAKHKLKVFDAVIFIIANLSTLSGASLIPMLVILMAYMFENKKMGNFVGIALLGVLIIVLMQTGMFDEITDKLAGEGETNSLTLRMTALKGGVQVFLQHPFFGAPPDAAEDIKREYSRQFMDTINTSSTNTFINYFAYYGVFVGVYLCVNTFKMINSFVKSKVTLILLCVAYFLTTSNENMTTSLMIVTLAFMRCSDQMMQSIKGRYYAGSGD